MDARKLISAVKLRTFIYNKNDKRHSDRDLVAAAWENIAIEVGDDVTATDCKNKWASLRDHFRKKHKELSVSVSRKGVRKPRKWYLYDFLTFLIPSCFTESRNGHDQDSQYKNESSDDQNQEIQSLSSQDTQSDKYLTSDDDGFLPVVTQHNKKRRICSSGKKSVISGRHIDKTAINTFRKVHTEVPMDENEHFFKSLVPVMKTLDVMQALELRGEIQKLVVSFIKSVNSQATETHAQQTLIPSEETKTVVGAALNEVARTGLLPSLEPTSR